ncbi:MAG: DNA alkylation repair protein [Bdellovibrio sp.]|nr:DNA alkylation repair protein [Bdellovibrio sp.]
MALVQKDIRSQGGSKERVAALQKFFDTGPGGYGEGYVFISLRVPQSRAFAKKYIYLDLKDVQALLKSKIHEERLIALLILVARFKEADAKEQKQIYDIYLKNTRSINNWDLVDTSAEHIVGAYLWDKNRKVLSDLIKSKDLWERRIAMLATFHFIKKGESKDALRFAKMLLKDEHDLMHKASGWMLRELGKRVSEKDLRAFLEKHAHVMPRTMLRYALEKLSAQDRAYYMGLKKVRT